MGLKKIYIRRGEEEYISFGSYYTSDGSILDPEQLIPDQTLQTLSGSHLL
jgi:hypothetical protein